MPRLVGVLHKLAFVDTWAGRTRRQLWRHVGDGQNVSEDCPV